MIRCIINGVVAYPSSTEQIKITYENQFIKDSGSYTYDISFPMDIHENKVIFGNINRLDVKKTISDFEDCKLYADNRLVMSGKGTVTSVTNDIVKLQLVGGKSRIKFNSKFESHFIDEIDYPSVVITKGIDREAYSQIGVNEVDLSTKPSMVLVNLTDWNYVGQPGVAAFNPINDEGNEDLMRNNIFQSKFDKLIIDGHDYRGRRIILTDLAVQPNLMYVIRKVMEYEGYSLIQNDFDVEPWNRLIVASAMQSVRIKDALPHWTVYTFLEEVRKFFDASIIFDEMNKTVRIVSSNELTNNDTVSYECSDEYNCEYEDDGLSYIGTSNLEYSFDNSAYRDWRECISQGVQKQFDSIPYDSVASMVAHAESMTTKKRRTTIFRIGDSRYIWAMLPESGNPDDENLTEQKTQCGFFNPIIRDIESDDYIDLKICPVAIHQRRKHLSNEISAKNWFRVVDAMPNSWIFVPSVTNEKQAAIDDMSADDDGEYYVSVQDAMESGSESTSIEEKDNTSMPVMFQGKEVINIEAYQTTPYNEYLSNDEGWQNRLPITYTDYRMHPVWSGLREKASLTLDRLQRGTLNIDKHNLITFTFITEDIPDPTKIYVFRNKKYICQKIEVEIVNGEISEMKKGYFYELI